jgi:hypothetical protein
MLLAFNGGKSGSKTADSKPVQQNEGGGTLSSAFFVGKLSRIPETPIRVFSVCSAEFGRRNA